MKNKFRNFKWWEWLLLPFAWDGPLGLVITLAIMAGAIWALFRF